MFTAAAEHAGLASLAAHIETAISKDKKTSELEHKWLKTKNDSVGPAAVKIDVEIDRAISGLVDLLRVHADVPVDTAAKAPATRLSRSSFRRVLLASSTSHEEEAAAIDVILGRMKGELAADVASLPLAPYVTSITELNAALRAELVKKPKDLVSFDVVSQGRPQRRRAVNAPAGARP